MTTMFDFIRDSINYDNPELDIPGHLGEVSVIYRLFAGMPDIDIYASVKDGAIGFSILSEKEDEAINLKQKVNNLSYEAYGYSYKIKAKSHKNTVNIIINREGS